MAASIASQSIHLRFTTALRKSLKTLTSCVSEHTVCAFECGPDAIEVIIIGADDLRTSRRKRMGLLRGYVSGYGTDTEGSISKDIVDDAASLCASRSGNDNEGFGGARHYSVLQN